MLWLQFYFFTAPKEQMLKHYSWSKMYKIFLRYTRCIQNSTGSYSKLCVSEGCSLLVSSSNVEELVAEL